MYTKRQPKLYFEKTGSGKPLIMLHGNKGNHHIFDGVVPVLQKDFTLYLIDSRGHGKSDGVKEFHYSDMADDILNLIEEEGLERPYFYGFSDGGIIGLMCAVKKENAFSKLAVSGANITVKGLKPQVLLGMKMSALLTRDGRTKMMTKEPCITPRQLNSIKCETLVTAGQFDIVREDETRLIADSIENSRLMIFKGRNHGDYVSQSEFIAKILKDFFIE
ncbi:MAG: alpha/beta fold hydrolase [Eubacterium sp.]